MGMYLTLCPASDALIDAWTGDPAAFQALLEAGEGELPEEVDLDKAWHGLHFLLTRTAWEGTPPLNFIVAGGEPLGEDDGYGPPRAFRSSDVKRIFTALGALSDDDLAKRFDPATMTKLDIYPSIWDRPREEDDTLGYLLGYLAVLRKFISDTVNDGNGMIVSVQ